MTARVFSAESPPRTNTPTFDEQPCPQPTNGPWPCSQALGKWVNGEPPSLEYFDVVSRGDCRKRGLLREVWYTLPGAELVDLLDHPDFPDIPMAREQVGNFDMPYNAADDYGARMRGYLIAPIEGVYQFWLSSDREAILLMGRGEDPATARTVARVSMPTMRYDWLNSAEQRSPLIYLRVGEKIYLEALHKEADGLDHLAVAWRMPGQALTSQPVVIEPRYLCQYERPRTPVKQIAGYSNKDVIGTGDLAWPAKGRISQYFHSKHRGLDLAIPQGTPVQAADKGEVVFLGWRSCYGNLVILDHGAGLRTYYAHLKDISVVAGQTVERGDAIGFSGNTGCSTGPHLHFEVHDGQTRVNPLELLPAAGR